MARFLVVGQAVRGAAELGEAAAESHRGVFRAEPAGEVAGLVLLELVALGVRVEEDEIRDAGLGAVERGGDGGAEGRPGEAGAVGVAAGKQVDGLEVFGLLGVHAADHVEVVRDAGAAGHERGEMHAGDGGRDAAERAAARAARLGIPGFELAGRPAEPEEQAVSLRAFGGRGESGMCEEPTEAAHGGRAGSGEPLEKQPAVEPVVIRGALAWRWRRSGHAAVGGSMIGQEFGAADERPEKLAGSRSRVFLALLQKSGGLREFGGVRVAQ